MSNKKEYAVPETAVMRRELRAVIAAFVEAQALQPPLSLTDIKTATTRFVEAHPAYSHYREWIMVALNNCVWQEIVATTPHERRILLLPQCMSNAPKCEATFDELGLLCHRCSRCHIPSLQDKAEELGMMSIVSEGFSAVMGLVENRVVDVVIGVSCLDSLEKAFPLMVDNAVAGLAIPLNEATCRNTTVDYDYVEELMTMRSEKEHYLLDYDYLKTTIKGWFAAENIDRLMTQTDDITAQIAKDWLAGDGKRWRPYLLAATYMALKGTSNIPEDISLAAIAVECFHKASLVHDDIQDNDNLRYGKQTVNAAHGANMAINVGDMLLGEGYRVLTRCEKMELVRVASQAHIALCKGQGMELGWCEHPTALTMDFVLDVFLHKTSPAFDVALAMGVICADADRELISILHNYSEALGIAYQLQDDIEDFDGDIPIALRPSSVLAVLCEQHQGTPFVEEMLARQDINSFLKQEANQPLLAEAIAVIKSLADEYHQRALNSLNEITSIELKRLLFRVTQRILS